MTPDLCPTCHGRGWISVVGPCYACEGTGLVTPTWRARAAERIARALAWLSRVVGGQ